MTADREMTADHPISVGIVLREQDLSAWAGGARTTEALRCVRHFMSGEEVDFHGRFFELRGAIRPAPAIPIPILVGGRSEAALQRAGEARRRLACPVGVPPPVRRGG